MERFLSRKFLLTLVAVVYTITAASGFDIPVDQVVVVDAVVAVYVLVEAVLDAISMRS